jgi:hypothetical protein
MNEKDVLKKEVAKLEKEKRKLDIKLAKEKAKSSVNKFNKELKKSLLTALVAAFAFILGLSWRDLIIQYVNNIISLSSIQSKLIEVIIVTLICVLGIIIVTKLLKDKE